MFVRRHKLRASPLRSLLRTPGLVACYLPWLQIAQGATGQTLLDYSPQGNDAQLGSTAGVDTNDPTWGSNALTFSGDDYCVTPDFGVTSASILAVFKNDSEAVNLPIFSRNNLFIRHDEANGKVKIYCNDSSTGYVLANQTVTTLPAGAWGIVTARLGAVGEKRSSISLTASPNTSNTLLAGSTLTIGSGTAYGDYLGRGYNTFNGIGNIASEVVFSRWLTDAELLRARQNLVALMNGQEVMIA